MNAVVVANGELQSNVRLRDLWEQADLRIAANGGARNARLVLERAPQIVVGDLDSVDDATREWLTTAGAEIVQYPAAKDETDLELAINLARTRGADQVAILGALGGRVDHMLANILLLSRAPNARIVDAGSEFWVGDGRATIQGTPGDIVSLIPLDSRVDGVETQNLEYPLRREVLERGGTRGISNVMLGTIATVTWSQGKLLVLHLFQKRIR